jgi:hypothetical protein
VHTDINVYVFLYYLFVSHPRNMSKYVADMTSIVGVLEC